MCARITFVERAKLCVVSLFFSCPLVYPAPSVIICVRALRVYDGETSGEDAHGEMFAVFFFRTKSFNYVLLARKFMLYFPVEPSFALLIVAAVEMLILIVLSLIINNREV